MHQAQSSPYKIKALFILLLSMLFFSLAGLCNANEKAEQFDEGTTLLLQKNFQEKKKGIEKIATSGDKRAEAILLALLDGKLFRIKKDNTLVYARVASPKIEITAALSGKPLGSIKKRKLKKISINNTLRSTIKDALAKIDLTNPDPQVRKDAVNKLTTNLTMESSTLLAKQLQSEQDNDVREALTTAMAITALRSGDNEARMLALNDLKGNLNPAVHNELTRLIRSEERRVGKEC